MIRTLLLFVPVFLFSFISFNSCVSGDEYFTEEFGMKIGAEGGKYEGVDGVTLIVPRNALNKTITVTISSIDTATFTNSSFTATLIYHVSPAAYKFEKEVTIVIPYDENEFSALLLDESDLKPYFSMDRAAFEPMSEEQYEMDLENNIVKITTKFLGYFHLGFPKEIVESTDPEGEGIAQLVFIPEGEFEYGAPKGTETEIKKDEEGIEVSEGTRQVDMTSYSMDKYEVTNAQYLLCVNAGVCTEPYYKQSSFYGDYFGNSAYSNYPVIWVSWNQANTFCQWAGKQLPTEAQWEKAARGSDGFQKYPWGDEEPQDNAENAVANYSIIFDDVTDVSNFSQGASPYGVFNMSGNVAEWVRNWHDFESYYRADLPEQQLYDPLGPSMSPSNEKVIKGGSWTSLDYEITTYARDRAHPHYRYYNIGFRCVKEE